MSLETRRICDICGKPIESSGESRRQFKVKENVLNSLFFSLARRVNCEDKLETEYACDLPLRSWIEIDCHTDCVIALLDAKNGMKERANERCHH